LEEQRSHYKHGVENYGTSDLRELELGWEDVAAAARHVARCILDARWSRFKKEILT